MKARRVRQRVTVFVEGGSGDKSSGSDRLNQEARNAFRKLAESAGLARVMPAFVVCGGRWQAYLDFKNAPRRDDTTYLLLVDSEGPVTASSPWEHVHDRKGDGWERPENATDDDLHFMVECMEAWLVADPDALEKFFGKGFDRGALPKNPNFEKIAKVDLLKALARAVQGTKKAGAKESGLKGTYAKGASSFKCLGKVNPALLTDPWAKRFFARLRDLAGR